MGSSGSLTPKCPLGEGETLLPGTQHPKLEGQALELSFKIQCIQKKDYYFS